MTINDELLKKARAAGNRLADAEGQVQMARTEYHRIVRRMHLSGGSLREIAQALELSHQRVQQMVDGAGGSWWQRVWRSRSVKGDLICTFCKRTQDQVEKLIAGPKVFIGDACVALAEKSMTAGSRPPSGFLVLAGERTRARCSFCGKRRESGRPLLTGPAANLCAECLLVCRQILIDSAA